jgi:hypothetical protein
MEGLAMAVIDPALAAFVEGDAAQTIGTADAARAPTVGRAWGLRVRHGHLVRALIGADDATTPNLRVGARVAVLLVDVATYRSVQLKGSVVDVEAPTASDHDVHEVYVAEFVAALRAADRHTSPDGALPAQLVSVTIDVDAAFDQTPGPGAGRALGGVS